MMHACQQQSCWQHQARHDQVNFTSLLSASCRHRPCSQMHYNLWQTPLLTDSGDGYAFKDTMRSVRLVVMNDDDPMMTAVCVTSPSDLETARTQLVHLQHQVRCGRCDRQRVLHTHIIISTGHKWRSSLLSFCRAGASAIKTQWC